MGNKRFVRVYGYSDDLVEIENSTSEFDEVDCYDKDVHIEFTDGTKIFIGFSKPNISVWYINVEEIGTAEHRFTVCDDENADIYSDIFEIAAEIKSIGVYDKV